MVEARAGPSKLPLAPFTLALPMAVRRSSIDMPSAASAVGLAWMRTAGRCPPLMVTSPTPWICEILAPTRVSTMSCSLGRGRVSEVIASVMIGASAGLTLL
ncbi:hypothetical protein D3C87_1517310 [compost metagenome]